MPPSEIGSIQTLSWTDYLKKLLIVRRSVSCVGEYKRIRLSIAMAGKSGLTFQKWFQLGFCLSRFKIIAWKIK